MAEIGRKQYRRRMSRVELGEAIFQLIELELLVVIRVELFEDLFEPCAVQYVGMPQIKNKSYL